MNWLPLILGGICAASGVTMIVRPGKKREAALARKAELAAGAPERYFEERRTIDAYPSPATDNGWRMKGVAITLLGVAVMGMALYR